MKKMNLFYIRGNNTLLLMLHSYQREINNGR